MIYEVEYIRATERLSVYAGTTEELINLLFLLEDSVRVKAWKISQFKPEDFG